MAAFSQSLAELLPLWQSALGGGKLAAIKPSDPWQRQSELFQSLNRYLQGDLHQLDLETAEAVRTFSCEQCLGNHRLETVHFCAAALLVHLLYFDGAGFGHTEAPLVLAISTMRLRGSWLLPTSRLLGDMYCRHARVQMGADAAFVGVPATLLGEQNRDYTAPELEQNLNSDLEHLAREANGDLYAHRLVFQLMTEARRAPIALSQDSKKRLLRLYQD
jgi:hypothetical protein